MLEERDALHKWETKQIVVKAKRRKYCAVCK